MAQESILDTWKWDQYMSRKVGKKITTNRAQKPRRTQVFYSRLFCKKKNIVNLENVKKLWDEKTLILHTWNKGLSFTYVLLVSLITLILSIFQFSLIFINLTSIFYTMLIKYYDRISVFTVFILRSRCIAYTRFLQYRKNNKRFDILFQDYFWILCYFDDTLIAHPRHLNKCNDLTPSM